MDNIEKIETGTYNIYFGEGIFDQLKAFTESGQYSKLFILVDENTRKNCLPILLLSLNKLQDFNIIQILSGEEQKNITSCVYVWEKLSELGANRKSLLINLGGGVIGDMGGFIASTYQRGMDFINIPTTLLSQVDASVGGKLAIDFNNLKNQIGLFCNPKAVFIFSGFLNTLSSRQLLSGFAEIIKHALIFSEEYWQQVKKFSFIEEEDLSDLVKKSVEIKNEIVTKDPFEHNLRKSLNFGHTIGHALESYSLLSDPEPLLHGEAIAAGMICESYISSKKSGLSKSSLDEISGFIISKFGKSDFNDYNLDKVLNFMKHDKKNESDKINFTLLNKIGQSEINHNCSFEEIIGALEYYISL